MFGGVKHQRIPEVSTRFIMQGDMTTVGYEESLLYLHYVAKISRHLTTSCDLFCGTSEFPNITLAAHEFNTQSQITPI